MPRPLREAHRPGRAIKVGYEVRPSYGLWAKVVSRTEIRDSKGARVVSIALKLDNGQVFHVQPSQTLISRYQPTA